MSSQDEMQFARSYEEGLRYIQRGGTHVKMRSLQIGTARMMEIARLVETNNTLRHLDLGKNKIGDAAIKVLAKSLVVNYALEELILSSNIIGLKGALALADALKVNNTLVKLNLAMNGVGPSGCAALREALGVNKGLTWLKLSQNGIGEDECRLLVDVIAKKNRRMIALSMDENGMSDITEERLREVLKANNMLKEERERMHKEKLEKLVENGLAVSEFRRCRLFTIGQGRVGKTATIRSLLSLPFNPQWDSTVGAEIKYAYAFPNRVWAERKPMQSNTTELAIRIASEESKDIREDKVKLSAVSPKPASPKAQTNPTATQGASKDAEEEKSEEPQLSAAELRRQQRLAAIARRANVNLEDRKEGNKKASEPKLSLLDRTEVAHVLKQPGLSKEMKIQSEALCFNIWDFGGQDVFYTLHHLFLTRHGVYLFVFDLREVSTAPSASAPTSPHIGNAGEFTEYFKFWLNSVQLHASGAPIVLAGTFADEAVSGNVEEMERQIQKVVLSSGGGSANIVPNTADKLSFFPIDNKSSSGVTNLATTLTATAEAQEYVHRLVSLRWMKCLDEIMNIKPPKGHDKLQTVNHLRRANHPQPPQQQQQQQQPQAQQPNGEGEGEDGDGMDAAERLRELRLERIRQRMGHGKRLNEDKGSVTVKKKDFSDWVTLAEVKERGRSCGIQSVQELEDMLSLFHALGMIVHLTSTEALRSIVTVQPQWLVDAISKVIRDGTVHAFETSEIRKARLDKDVKRMFEQALVSQDLLEFLWKDNGQAPFLLDLMRRSMLLSEWGFEGDELYLCPSLLKPTTAVQGSSNSEVFTCRFDFSASFLPIGVYERLICLCVAQSGNVENSTTPQLSKQVCKIWFGGSRAFVVTQKDIGIELSTEDKSLANEMHSVASAMLRKIKQDVMSNGLNWETKVKINEKWVTLAKAEKEKIEPWYNPRKKEATVLESANLEDFLTSL